MIFKIVCYLLFPMAIFACFLALLGVEHIGYGNDYYQFMMDVSQRYQSWSLKIPGIPQIVLNDVDFDGKGEIIILLVKIGRFFVNFINGLVSFLNVIVWAINIVIQLIQFFLTFIYSCKDFIGYLTDKWSSLARVIN